MKIAVIGGASGVGYEATQQALTKGHKVTVLSPNANSLSNHINLTKINGSALNRTDVTTAIKDTDAVLITFGTKQKKGTTLFSAMAQAVVSAATTISYDKPVIIISGFGVGDGYRSLSILMKIVINLFLKDQYKDKAIMEQIFSSSNLNWELVQPGILNDGKLISKYKTYSSFFKGMKVGKISRADVAHYMLIEAANPANLRQKVAITY